MLSVATFPQYVYLTLLQVTPQQLWIQTLHFQIYCSEKDVRLNVTQLMNVTINATDEPGTQVVEQNVTMEEVISIGDEKCKWFMRIVTTSIQVERPAVNAKTHRCKFCLQPLQINVIRETQKPCGEYLWLQHLYQRVLFKDVCSPT